MIYNGSGGLDGGGLLSLFHFFHSCEPLPTLPLHFFLFVFLLLQLGFLFLTPTSPAPWSSLVAPYFAFRRDKCACTRNVIHAAYNAHNCLLFLAYLLPVIRIKHVLPYYILTSFENGAAIATINNRCLPLPQPPLILIPWTAVFATVRLLHNGYCFLISTSTKNTLKRGSTTTVCRSRDPPNPFYPYASLFSF